MTIDEVSITSISIPTVAVMAAVGALLALVLLVIAWRVLRRRKPAEVSTGLPLAIDLASLGEEGPPAGPPVLEFYNVPVRVAAVVLAPAGRRDLAQVGEMSQVLDAIVPGLERVIALHKPLICHWPRQLSARGFAHIFFANVRLPGDGGKGTPWSSAAGIIKFRGQPVMAGLVLCAASPNAFGQMTLDSEEKWLGSFRVRYRGE